MLALGLTFVACDDDDDDSFSSDSNPEVAAEGTYTGTWTRELDGEEESGTGTLTVTATDSSYCADITFYCADLDLDATSVANITYAGSTTTFKFYNTYADGNGLGASFSGMIEDGTATASFTLTVKSGRKSYEYDYTFEGSK